MTASPHIMVVDDEPAAREMVGDYLRMHGFGVSLCDGGASLRKTIAERMPDLIILDLNMPEEDGLSIIRDLKQRTSVPIIMLTATASAIDRVVGLELGADDYLAKPFEPRELVARLQAVLRRTDAAGAMEVRRAGGIEVNWTTRRATRDGAELALTTAEFHLPGLLVRHRGRVLTRERILDETRGVDWDAYDRSVDVLVSRLRQKLGDDPRRPAFIRTVRGAGYCFSGGDT